MSPVAARPLAERYEEKVDRSDVDGCHPWTGHRDRNGYGRLHVGGSGRLAHRIGWMLHFGPAPEDLHVCHRCDNPPCQNPRHWFLGTNAENVQDMVSKGRQRMGPRGPSRRGEACPTSKLTWEAVSEMRQLYAAGGISQRALGERFGVSQGNVGRILSGASW